jgi:hypothetical protein
MMMTTTLKPSIDLADQVIRVDEITSRDPMDQLLAQHYSTIVRTRDRMVRAALIAMGWTPPAEDIAVADTPTSDETRRRVRANDAASSVIAAEAASRFADTHKERILRALRDDELSSHQIAKLSGLSVVQADRRLPELQRDGQVEVVLVDGEELLRAGYRVWRRFRTSGN